MLFRPNIVEPLQVAELVRTLRKAGPAGFPLGGFRRPGGRIGAEAAPAAHCVARHVFGGCGRRSRAQRGCGTCAGGRTGGPGHRLEFRPGARRAHQSANPVIGNRAFGATPAAAATHALAFWHGLRAAGVLGCGKHFPGHGDTQTDSHLDLPVVVHDDARLRAVELAPFAAAVAAGLSAIMTAHVMYPAWDAQLPATLSPRIARDILRGDLGFGGLLVSDDLGMRAVADRWPIEELVVQSLLAGVDHFLVREPRERQEAALAALVRAAETRPEVRARVQESAARGARFKALLSPRMPAERGELLARLARPSTEPWPHRSRE